MQRIKTGIKVVIYNVKLLIRYRIKAKKSILISYTCTNIMRGRIASFAIGSAVAKRRTSAAMTQAQQAQQAQQKEIDQLKAAQMQQAQPSQPQQSNQEDITVKLQKLADLHQKGILSDEEFQKLKMELISKL